uniref:Ras-GEF domain-containing protein n=1 Tax=Panagrolaimus superbus TaxID=310955 RepID=A0A914Y2X5_9BILA
MDYDDLKKGSDEPDYDKVKAKEVKPVSKAQSPPEPSHQQPQHHYQQHRTKTTFAQLRAISQPPKQIRHLLNYFASLTIEKLSFLITSEDIKVFNLTQSNNNNNNNDNNGAPTNNLKKLFLSESRLLREEVLDRNACLQLTVSMTIQKAHNPKDILKVWILTAAHLLHKIGNGFSFGALMTAIICEKSKRPRAFTELDASTMAHFKALSPIYEDFIAGKMPPSIAGCFLPFIQPLLQLFSTSSDYVQANKLKNINSNGLDNLEILSNMILLARHIIFENNGKLEDSIENSKMSGPNPFSTESLIHCLLATPSLSTEPKESERRKIRQMFEQNN